MNQQRLCKRESSLSQEEDFIRKLEEYSKDHPYPFCEEKEKRTFGYIFKRWPQIDFVSMLEKILDYLKRHPEALEPNKKDRREQLLEEFLWKEIEKWWKESALKDHRTGIK